MITEIKGDLLETDCKIIAHGVNCQNTMGSGVAKALYTKWPEVKEKYHFYCELNNHRDPEELLGSMTFAYIKNEDKYVANCFTQQNYGKDGQMYLSYFALHQSLSVLKSEMLARDIYELAIPKIGCGLAGGNWEKVKQVIKTVFNSSVFEIKVYYLEDK